MMKHFLLMITCTIIALALTACGQSGAALPNVEPEHPSATLNQPKMTGGRIESSETAVQTEDDTMVLVAYFSRTGNTELVAQEIQAQIGGELFEIVPEDPYPDEYNATVEHHRQEDAADARPAISSFVTDMDSYDVIFVGYPIWGGDMPHVVRTFLEQYDFSDKTVIPFCTHGGSGLSRSVQTLKMLCPNSSILEGFAISGNSAANSLNEVGEWLDGLEF